MALELWTIGATANVIVSLAYLSIAYFILGGLVRSRQLLMNPLALATGGIFLSCAIGHGVHASHALLPVIGLDLVVGEAARIEMADWHSWLADGTTAIIALWYVTLRGRLPAFVRGTAMFEDMRVRQREALEIHDNIVQGLAKAKLNFEVGRPDQGMKEIEGTLAASRRIITGLLGDAGSELGLKPGQMRRDRAADARSREGR